MSDTGRVEISAQRPPPGTSGADAASKADTFAGRCRHIDCQSLAFSAPLALSLNALRTRKSHEQKQFVIAANAIGALTQERLKSVQSTVDCTSRMQLVRQYSTTHTRQLLLSVYTMQYDTLHEHFKYTIISLVCL